MARVSQDHDTSSNSFIRRWQLAETLRNLRDEAGLTVDEAGARLAKLPGRWSKSKLSRIENRDQMIKPRELEQVLDIYGVTSRKQREALHDTVEAASERGWWVAFRRAMPDRFQPFVSMEAAAVSIREFECMNMPGLLQTAEYARALIIGMSPELGADELERRVALRMARQQILSRENPVSLHVILDEGILERPVGRPATMRAQLRRLMEFAEEPHGTVQILRRSAGPHYGLQGPFTLVSLPDPLPTIGYTDGHGGNIYLESSEAVRDTTMGFGMLTRLALSTPESVDMISMIMKGYE